MVLRRSSCAAVVRGGLPPVTTALIPINNNINNNINNKINNNIIINTQARSFGLAVHDGKSDVWLGKFEYEREIMESRKISKRQPDFNMKQFRATYWRLDEFVRRAQQYMETQTGFFFLPTLDFPIFKGCLPLFSGYQLRVHYGRHHRAYVDKLNVLIKGTELYGLNLDEIIIRTRNVPEWTGIYNNAAQHYNHSFFWKSITPYGTNIPPDLKAAVEAQYGSVGNFEKSFRDAGMGLFGSGWVYWVWDNNANRFDFISYSNAGCPLGVQGVTPLLCADVWEHTYYIDYENDRANYLSKYFDVVDYHWAERHWKRARGEKYEEMGFF